MQHCGQGCVGKLKSDADGKVLKCADDQSELWKIWIWFFAEKVRLNFFLGISDFTHSEIRVIHLHRRGSDMSRGSCAMCTRQREICCL